MIIELEGIWMGNSLSEWGTALGMALCINLVVAVLKWAITHHLAHIAENSAAGLNDAAVAMARRTKQTLIFGITLMIGTRYLDMPNGLDHVLMRVATLCAFLQLGFWLSAGLDFWVSRYRGSLGNDAGATTSLAALHFVARLVMWALLVMLALDNLGVNVSAMVAGLGVGGIAVALAVQNILGDLFASLSIVLDKPFVVGDVISVDLFTGTVEHVGLKTTRLRSASGEQIIISNSDLLKTRIRNFKRMEERRMLFSVGVVYQTRPAQLAAIPDILQQIISGIPGTRFERAHFKSFSPSSLDFEVVYWMRTADFMASMDAQQRVNLGLVEAFARDGIEFASSTQTLIVQAPSGRQERFPGASA